MSSEEARVEYLAEQCTACGHRATEEVHYYGNMHPLYGQEVGALGYSFGALDCAMYEVSTAMLIRPHFYGARIEYGGNVYVVRVEGEYT